MNQVVAIHRQSVPNDPRTDAQLTQAYGESANSANLQQQYPDFAADYQAIQDNNKAANQPSMFGDFSRGVSSGVSSLESTAYGLGALGSSALGADSLKNYFAQKAQQSEADAAANQPSVASISDIHGASDAFHYLFGQAGQLAPNLAEAAITGTAGALAGGAAGEAVEPAGGGLPGAAGGLLYGILEKQAVKKLILDKVLTGAEDFTANAAAKQAVVKATKELGVKYGTHLAETLNFYGQSAGSTYNTLSQDPNVDPSTAINVSLLGGLAQALPAQILPSAIVKQFFGAESASVAPYYVRLASQAAKLVPAGMAGMSLQELASIASDKYADPATRDQAFDITQWSKADRDRLVNASAVGGLAGLIGAPVAAVPKGETKIPDAVRNYVGDLNKPENKQIVQDLADMAFRENVGRNTLADQQAMAAFTPEQRAAYVAIKSQVEKSQVVQPLNLKKPEGEPDDSDLGAVVNRIMQNSSPLVKHPELDDTQTVQQIQNNLSGRIPAAEVSANVPAPVVANNAPTEKPLSPLTPAIKIGDQYFTGNNHGEAVQNAAKAGADFTQHERGFVANGKFIDRKTAAALFKESNPDASMIKEDTGELHSEDLHNAGYQIDQNAPKPDWRVAVTAPNGEHPGHVQIVDVPHGTEVPSVESLKAKGYDVPDFSKLPEGSYSWEQATKAIEGSESYGDKWVRLNGIESAKGRVRTLDALIQQETDIKTRQGNHNVENLIDEADNIRKAINKVEPDWVSDHGAASVKQPELYPNKYSDLAREASEKADKAISEARDNDDHYFASSKAKAAAGAHDFAANKLGVDRGIASNNLEMMKRLPSILSSIDFHKSESERYSKIADEQKALSKSNEPTPQLKITPDSLDFNRTGVSQKSSGKVQEPVYFEIKPGEKNLNDRLVSGARDVSGKGAYQNTRRLTAFEKDGKVYLLSTFRDSKSGEVRAFDPESKNDKKPNAAVSDLIDRGYQPIASLRTQEAQKNFSQVYPSREAFEQHMGQPARDRVALERSQIGDEPSQAVKPVSIAEPFNEDHASALWHALGGEDEAPKNPKELGELIRRNMADDGEARNGLQQAIGSVQKEHPDLNEDEQIALTLKKLYESISAGYSGGETEFTQSAIRNFGETDKGAAGGEPPSSPKLRTPSQQEGGAGGGVVDNPANVKPTELLRQDVTARHAGLLNNIHRAAIDAGLNVLRISQDLSGMSGEFAKRTGAAYDSASRTVAQVVADVVGREDIVTSFHEVGHDVFSRLSPEMAARALAAVDKMGDRQLGLDISADPRIRQTNPDRLAPTSLAEERLTEATALRLTDAGFDPAQSKSYAAQFVRALKDLYFRAAMAIQRSLFGDDYTSPELALQYFENRVKQFLTGDFNRTSFLDMIGGGNPKEAKVASWQSNGSKLFERLGLDGKTVEYQHVADDSLASSRLNNLSFRQPDQDVDERRVKVEMRTALLNHQEGIIEKAAKDPAVSKLISELKKPQSPTSYVIEKLGLADPKSAKIEIDRALSADKTPLDYDKAKKIDDFKGRSNIDKAAHDAYVNAQAMASKVAAKKSKELDVFNKLTQKKDAVLQEHTELAKEHADWQGLTTKASQAMKREGRQLFSAIAGESKKRGAIEQQLRAIDPNADLRKYGPVFQKLFTGDELKGERLFTVLDKMANDPKIDLTKPMIDIRRAMFNDPDYHKFITGTPESNALTATIVAYAKTNARVMANLELRRMSNGEERQGIVDRLDTLKQEQGDFLKNFSLLAKTSKLEERVRQAYRKSLQTVRSMNRRMELARQRIAVADAMSPVLKEEQAKLAGKLAIGVDTTFGHGQEYAVPLSKDAPTDDLVNNRGGKDSLWQIHQINLDTSDPTKLSNPDEVEGHLRQMAEFLNERESQYADGNYDAKDAAYQGVKNAFDEIAAHKNFTLNVTPADRFMLELGVLGPGNKVQDAFGTPAARDIGRMVNRETSMLDSMRPQAERIWRRNEQLEDALIKLMPSKMANKRELLRSDFLNPAKKTMQSLHGLEERYADKPEALKAAVYNRVMDGLLTNDATKEIVAANKEAWRKGMVDLLEHQSESNKWFDRQARGEANQQVLGRQIDTGHGVKDEKLKALNPATGEQQVATRKGIPIGPYTFAQKMSEDFKGMVNALRNSGWVNKDGKSLAAADFGKIADMMRKNQDPTALVHKYFADPIHGDAVQNTFLRSLAQMDTESPFDGPKASDGETVQPLDIAKVNEAWDRSQGNPLAFAELLYDLHGGQDIHAEDGTPVQDKAGYVQQTMERMAEIATESDKIMSNMEPDPNDRRVSIRGMMSDFGLNARQIEHLPGQWFDYHSFDQRDTFNMMKRVAAQTAFGRNCETLATAFDTVNKEVAEAQFKLQNATRDVTRANPGLDTKGVRKALIAKLGEAEYKRITRFNDRAKFVKDAITDLSSYHRRDNSPDGTVNTITRVAHFIGSMMINQPSSAISLLTQLSDVNLRYGASKSVVGASIKSIGSAGKEVAASMAQAVGLQMFKGGELHDLYYRLGLQDPEMVRSLRDSFGRLEGEGRFTHLLRAAHDTLGVTINPKGEEAQHVPLQPFKPFDMVGSIVDQKITEQVWQLASQHIAQGIDYFKTHDSDLNDPNFKLDADKLGLKGAAKDSFMRLTGDMKRWDLDYNDMVRNSIQRGDNTPYTNAEALKLHSMAVSEIALRGSLSRSSASWYNNNIIRLAAPLIRWSFDRMVQVGGLRLNADGKRDMQSFARGIAGLSLAAGGGLAVSALLDQYYQHLLGKQRNIRPIVNAPNPQQFAMGVMEDLSRVGTFGMFGELANSLVGLGQGGDNRVLSVDQRVLAVSSLQSVFSAADAWYNQGFNADYSHVFRPLAGAVGLGGLIQYMQLANNALGLDNQEARVTSRINAQNYLRVVGRQLGMDVRVSDGGTFTPTPITPYMTRMELAAYKNSPSDFREAYQQAIQAAKEQGHDDPVQYVKANFASRNPLRAVFSTAPSQADYAKLLGNMPGSGEADVSEAVRLFNQYAASIGAKEFTGRTEKAPTFSTSLPRSPLQSFRERATAALQ